MAPQAIEAQKKRDSQGGYFVNDQGLVVYLNFQNIFEMFS